MSITLKCTRHFRSNNLCFGIVQIGAVAWDVIVYDEASCLSEGIVNIRAAHTLEDMLKLKPPVMFGITGTAVEHNYKVSRYSGYYNIAMLTCR